MPGGMSRMRRSFFTIGGSCLLAILAGCVPDEDTAPSAALFPTTHFGEVRPDFTGQLTSNSARQEVELMALFGVCYKDQDSRELKPVSEALSRGFYSNPQNGKRVYRVHSIAQAQELLQNSWEEEHWNSDSKLSKQFATTPNATVAIIGQTDQRILFFDQSNHLIGVYPSAG